MKTQRKVTQLAGLEPDPRFEPPVYETQPFAARLAALLGGEVTQYKPEISHRAEVTLPSGTILALSLDTRGGKSNRVRVSLNPIEYENIQGRTQMIVAGNVLKNKHDKDKALTEIWFDLGRGAFAIARDLKSRMLPVADRIYARMLAAAQKEAQIVSDQRAIIAALARDFEYEPARYLSATLHGRGQKYGSLPALEVRYDLTISFGPMHVSEEAARGILEILGAARSTIGKEGA